MSTLENKIALVTGASKGIGAGIAVQLAAAGATVVVNYSTSKEDADKVVEQIKAAGGKAEAVQGDFSKPEDIKRVFDEHKAKHGRVDVLVNNAGIYAFAPLADITTEHYLRHFNLNVMGLLLATQAAVALMPADGGSVINIGSIVGAMPMPQASVYCGTKGAVNAITISLSKELGARKIRVNALNPGVVATPGNEGMISAGHADGIIATTPLGRVGEPDDIGKVAVFLASDQSFWLTGQLINASGGVTL